MHRLVCFGVVILGASLLLRLDSTTATAGDQTDIATSALEFGGSLGRLIWVSVKDQQRVETCRSSYMVSDQKAFAGGNLPLSK